MAKPLFVGFCIWILSTVIGALLWDVSNFSFGGPKMSVYQVVAWTLGAVAIVGGALFPGMIAARHAIESHANFRKMAIVMGGCVQAYVFLRSFLEGTLDKLSLSNLLILGFIFWTFYSVIFFGMLWLGAGLSRTEE